MGLTIAKRCVENLFGKIWVESVLGKGSTFYFTFYVLPHIPDGSNSNNELRTTFCLSSLRHEKATPSDEYSAEEEELASSQNNLIVPTIQARQRYLSDSTIHRH